jgi:hypothetical protein
MEKFAHKADDEKRKQRAAIRKAAQKATSTPEAAKRFLVEAGIVTPSGKLTKAYR